MSNTAENITPVESAPAPEAVPAPVESSPQSAPGNASFGLLSGDFGQKDAQTQTEVPSDGTWTRVFGEEYRERPYLKDFKSADELLKSYENQRSLIGKRLEDMTPEQISEVRAKLGVPDSAENYKLTLPEEVSREGLNEAWFRATMREANIPQKEAQHLYSKYADLVQSQRAELNKAREAALTQGQAELDKAFGAAKPQRLEGIVNFMRETGGDKLLEKFNNSDLAADAQFVQFLGRMAEIAAEDRGVNLTQSSAWGTSPSQAQAMINGMRQDPDWSRKMQQDSDFRQRWTKLHQLAYPD